MKKIYTNLKEQQYIINNTKSFEPKHIFECGQCFRWNLDKNENYVGVIKEGILKVKKQENNILITGNLINDQDIKQVCDKYFDLNNNYEDIKLKLSNIDDNLKNSINYGYGIRILKQDLWETIISFIISANNNIPRIKGIIERLSKNYGNEIIWNGESYYTFPTYEELSNATVQDLRELGLGFRDKRVYETTHIILENETIIKDMETEEDTNILREKLLALPGVGPKVADCIMLFSLKKFDVFPIDVWVRRVMNDLYIKEKDETTVNRKQIENLAKEKYKNLAGLAQQYLFYWRREA